MNILLVAIFVYIYLLFFSEDSARVVLKSSVYEIGPESNYINAVFVSVS